MTARGDLDYSKLEALKNQPNAHDQPFLENSGKQVVSDHGKQVNTENTGLELAANDQYSDKYPANSGDQYHKPRRPRRRWLIFGGIAALLIVVAAILGGILGSRANKKSPPTTSSTISPPSSSSNASTTVQRQHNLAALSFAVNSVTNTRVYYQDNAGEIVEAANSAENITWINTKLGFFAKNGSAIAAAVSRPGFAVEITILYTDSNNLIHNVVYNPATDRWTEGDLSSEKYITSVNASLSALYHQCARCANTTIIAYQDINNLVQIGNETSDGWTVKQVNLNPIKRTGLALQPFYRAGIVDQINLYYQKSNLNLSLASWAPPGINDGGKTTAASWVSDVQTYNAAAPGTPIAAASSYSNVSTGYETWIELLSLSATGIEVDTWSGQLNDWLEHDNHPSSMANSTANAKTYGAVAVTALGQAFAAVSTSDEKYVIESWQVADDMVNWASTGTVDIGSAWD